MALKLRSQRLIKRLLSQPESGMTWQAATVFLKDGRSFQRVIISAGQITSTDRSWEPPFTEDEIVDIVVTHDRSGPPFQS